MGTSPKAGVIHQRLFRAIDKMRPGGRRPRSTSTFDFALRSEKLRKQPPLRAVSLAVSTSASFVAPRRRLRAGSRMVSPPKTTAPSSRTAAAGEGSRNGSCCGSGSVADLSAVFGRLTGRKALVKAKQSSLHTHVMSSRKAYRRRRPCKSELLRCRGTLTQLSVHQTAIDEEPRLFFQPAL